MATSTFSLAFPFLVGGFCFNSWSSVVTPTTHTQSLGSEGAHSHTV